MLLKSCQKSEMPEDGAHLRQFADPETPPVSPSRPPVGATVGASDWLPYGSQESAFLMSGSDGNAGAIDSEDQAAIIQLARVGEAC